MDYKVNPLSPAADWSAEQIQAQLILLENMLRLQNQLKEDLLLENQRLRHQIVTLHAQNQSLENTTPYTSSFKRARMESK